MLRSSQTSEEGLGEMMKGLLEIRLEDNFLEMVETLAKKTSLTEL